MIKLDKEYSDYTDETDVDAYPAGKAVDATTEESVDGTPYLKKWMNNIHGAFTALWVKAFGSVEGMSGQPDSAAHSDVLLAVEKLIELPLAAHRDTRGIDAHGATIAATPGQIVTRDALGRAKVAAPAAVDDIARKEEVDAEATVRESADNGLSSRINTEEDTRATADIGLQNQINSEVSTRAAADIGLQNQINVEAQTRANADSGLSGRITAETNTRGSTDVWLDSKINNLKNYSTGEVNTGKKWIDGRDIFRICASGNSSQHEFILFGIGAYRTVTLGEFNFMDYSTDWNCGYEGESGSWVFLRTQYSTGHCYLKVGGHAAGRPYTVTIEYVK